MFASTKINQEVSHMLLKVFLVFMLIAILAICLPLYKKIDPFGFPFYVVRCVFISAIWLYFVFFTNLFR